MTDRKYVGYFDCSRRYSVPELQQIATKLREDFVRAENLQKYCQEFETNDSYIMVSIVEYMERLRNTQFLVGRWIEAN